MKPAIALAAGLAVFVFASLAQTNAQGLIRVKLSNRSHQDVYIFVYDSLCRFKAFEGMLGDQSSATISICQDDRGRGHIVIYDPRGRNQGFANLRDASSVPVRFR